MENMPLSFIQFIDLLLKKIQDDEHIRTILNNTYNYSGGLRWCYEISGVSNNSPPTLQDHIEWTDKGLKLHITYSISSYWNPRLPREQLALATDYSIQKHKTVEIEVPYIAAANVLQQLLNETSQMRVQPVTGMDEESWVDFIKHQSSFNSALFLSEDRERLSWDSGDGNRLFHSKLSANNLLNDLLLSNEHKQGSDAFHQFRSQFLQVYYFNQEGAIENKVFDGCGTPQEKLTRLDALIFRLSLAGEGYYSSGTNLLLLAEKHGIKTQLLSLLISTLTPLTKDVELERFEFVQLFLTNYLAEHLQKETADWFLAKPQWLEVALWDILQKNSIDKLKAWSSYLKTQQESMYICFKNALKNVLFSHSHQLDYLPSVVEEWLSAEQLHSDHSTHEMGSLYVKAFKQHASKLDLSILEQALASLALNGRKRTAIFGEWFAKSRNSGFYSSIEFIKHLDAWLSSLQNKTFIPFQAYELTDYLSLLPLCLQTQDISYVDAWYRVVFKLDYFEGDEFGKSPEADVHRALRVLGAVDKQLSNTNAVLLVTPTLLGVMQKHHGLDTTSGLEPWRLALNKDYAAKLMKALVQILLKAPSNHISTLSTVALSKLSFQISDAPNESVSFEHHLINEGVLIRSDLSFMEWWVVGNKAYLISLIESNPACVNASNFGNVWRVAAEHERLRRQLLKPQTKAEVHLIEQALFQGSIAWSDYQLIKEAYNTINHELGLAYEQSPLVLSPYLLFCRTLQDDAHDIELMQLNLSLASNDWSV